MTELEQIFGPAIKAVNSNTENSVEPGVVGHVDTPVESAGLNESDVNTPSMSALATEIMTTMRINYDNRRNTGIDEKLNYSLMAHTCQYDKKQKAYLEKIGIKERVYFPLTSSKNRAAKSMLIELANNNGEVPFLLKPTPDPEVSEEVQMSVVQQMENEIAQLYMMFQSNGVTEVPPEAQAKIQELVVKLTDRLYDETENKEESYASDRAKRLQRKVWDLMVEGGYEDAALECIDNAIVYGTCVMAGPILRNEVRNEVVKDKKNGVRKLKRVIKTIPVFESLSPIDCYPSPDAKKVTDGALCVRVKYTKEELWRFKQSCAKRGKKVDGAEGWRDNAISLLLSRNEFGTRLTEFPVDPDIKDSLHNDANSTEACKFEGVRYFSYVEGVKLLELGITQAPDGTKISNYEFYYTEAIVIGGMVVFCRIYDERIGSPLSKAVFYEVPGSWWGECIADKVYSTQAVMNNAMVSLLRNMGPSSAAMMWINDISRLADKSPSALSAEPGKIFGFGASYTGQTQAGAPMGVLQIPSNASELLAVAKWAIQQADLDSGIPAFSEGSGGSQGGALRTAEGLRTFTEAMSRGMKMIIVLFDKGITCDTARRMANWVLINDDDMELKGDVEVVAVGMMGRMHKAQYDQSRLQFSNMVINSQFLQGIFGVKGVLALLRPSIKEFNVNPDDVCPSVEKIETLEQIEQIKQIFAATQASNGVQQAAAQGGGAPSGIEQPPAVKGGVSDRRGAA